MTPPSPFEICSMSFTRPLCAAFASITLVGTVWMLSAQVATPCTTSPTTAAPAATLDDDEPPGAAGLPGAAELPPFQPVARVSSLMAGIGSAFGNMRDVFPQVGEEHRLGAIVKWSEVIAELSNVNTRHRRKPDYLAMAADTRSIALDLARAARAEIVDEDRLTALFATLDHSCSTCHDAND